MGVPEPEMPNRKFHSMFLCAPEDNVRLRVVPGATAGEPPKEYVVSIGDCEVAFDDLLRRNHAVYLFAHSVLRSGTQYVQLKSQEETTNLSWLEIKFTGYDMAMTHVRELLNIVENAKTSTDNPPAEDSQKFHSMFLCAPEDNVRLRVVPGATAGEPPKEYVVSIGENKVAFDDPLRRNNATYLFARSVLRGGAEYVQLKSHEETANLSWLEIEFTDYDMAMTHVREMLVIVEHAKMSTDN